MAKKRKVVTTPVARVKEVKSEIESPVKSPPSSPDPLEVTSTPSTSTTELVMARGKLKNVLQVLFDQSDESSESIPREDTLHEPPPPKVVIKKEKNQSPAPPSRLSGRKKRRRTQVTDQAFHHTYVMKLFDRSVDLAQFKEDTPLYPICRAWMANQPRNTNLGARRGESPSPEPVEEEEQDVAEEGNDAEGEGSIKKTYKMPPPLPLPTDPVLRQQLKIPAPIFREISKEIDMDAEVKPSRETLLREHVAHWTAVRKKWHSTGHKNEERFANSAHILKNIFKRAQRAFE